MCVHVFKCITLAVMSLLLGLPPPPTQYTHINTPSPSSLPGSTGQLSLLLVSADGVRGDRGVTKEGGWGWVARQLSRCRSPSWVRQGRALSQPPHSRAAAQGPAVLMIAPNRPGTSSLWWLAEEGVEVVQ